MPKLSSRLLRAQIALLNPLLKRMDLAQMRKLQDGLGGLGQVALGGGVEYEDAGFERFDAAWAHAKTPVAGKAILYLHGGSYTAGSLPYAKGFGGVLCELTGYDTLCVGYRLAPEHPHPAALEDALEAYQRIAKDYAPKDIALVGESAGGGLCFALALKLKQLHLEQPSSIVALSPWTDLTMSLDSCTSLQSVDPMLTGEGLKLSAHMYGGDDLKNPLISPLYGELGALAPTLIYAGTHEILLDDSTEMARRLREAGVQCELHLADGLWHAYVLYPTAESKEAQEHIRDFIWEASGHGAP